MNFLVILRRIRYNDVMDTIDDKKLNEFLAPVTDAEITPEHRAWMNAKIEATLEKKARGELSYTPLDDVRREFGLDAS